MEWDVAVDVVVAGSGAAGLTAAIAAAAGGLQVELFEKASVFGGTTAMGGGGIWIPCNPHMRALGIEDSREEAITYAMGTTDGRAPDPDLVSRYVDKAVEATTFLEENTPASFFVAELFSDYYVGREGSRRVGRTLDNRPYPAREELGEWDERLRRTPHYDQLTLDERSSGGRGGGAGAEPINDELVATAGQRERDGIRACGEALAATLLRGALDHGVAVHTDAPVVRVVLGDGGEVTGARVLKDGEELAVRARCGVVIATGGFEWNQDLVRAYLGLRELRPASTPSNTGDGVMLASQAGALLANMTEAWWFPVTSTGALTYDGSPLHIPATPRSQAGCITVNRHGRRFTNEAACYMDFGRAHRTYDPVAAEYPNEVAWCIFDQDVRDEIVLGDLRPGEPTPAWVREARTLAGLAGEIGVEAANLTDEVQRFNGFVAEGVDHDFGRGTLWFEGFTSGGPTAEGSLAPIERAPFYALRLYPGALGTCGGPRIDGHGRVLANHGGAIEGLYAAGNASASVFGPGYPGGGATLGPAITFGYLAGCHLATRKATALA